MTIRNFDALFQPRSIALIGASSKPASVGQITAQNLSRWRISGAHLVRQPKASGDRRPQLLSLRSIPSRGARSRRRGYASRDGSAAHCRAGGQGHAGLRW